MATILIIDDNETVRDGLAATVKKLGHEPVTAASGAAGIAAFEARRADFVITDLKMDGLGGVEVLRAISALDPDVPIMIVTGFGTVETAVEAMKLGAFDFLTKPFAPEVVRLKVERALELGAARRGRRKAEALTAYHRAEDDDRFPDLVGASDQIAGVRRAIEKVAPSDATVVHRRRERHRQGAGRARDPPAVAAAAERPFIKVNCGAITETLLESELFGHERGAFTGAIEQKLGRFELADGGTLFLDEVGDVPPAMQVKLLRAVQEQEFERVGGERADQGRRARSCRRPTRTSTPRSPPAGSARTCTTGSTSCRSRCRPCASGARTSRRWSLALPRADGAADQPAACAAISDAALGRLMAYHWPGNVRELENAVEQALVFAEGAEIGPAALPAFLGGGGGGDGDAARGAARAVAARDPRRPRAPAHRQGLPEGRRGQDRDRPPARHQDLGAVLQAREVQNLLGQGAPQISGAPGRAGGYVRVRTRSHRGVARV